MHSDKASNRLRRMTPYLITVGLGLSVASHAAEPEYPDEKQSEIPAPFIDTDGDGALDARDRGDDGQADTWDSDYDGRPDLLDDDGDGEPD